MTHSSQLCEAKLAIVEPLLLVGHAHCSAKRSPVPTIVAVTITADAPMAHSPSAPSVSLLVWLSVIVLFRGNSPPDEVH